MIGRASLVKRLLVISAACLMLIAAILLIFSGLILSMLGSTRSPDVKQEALDLAVELMQQLQNGTLGEPSRKLFPDVCLELLREKVADHGDQYALEVAAAFDANNPNYAIEGVKPPIGNRDAEITIRFPDKEGIVLYYYNGWGEMCYVPDE
jgi:hypothetical protein